MLEVLAVGIVAVGLFVGMVLGSISIVLEQHTEDK